MSGQSHRSAAEMDLEKLRSRTGLIALIFTILSVVVLAGLTAILLGGGVNSDNTVAIVTAAFGIISTVATAYFGIKATANTSIDAAAASSGSDSSDETVVARYEEGIKKSKVDRLNAEIDQREQKGEIAPRLAKELRDASIEAEEEARERHPQKGEGKA